MVGHQRLAGDDVKIVAPEHRRSLLLIEVRGVECRARIECSRGDFVATIQCSGELTPERAETTARSHADAAWRGHAIEVGLMAGVKALTERYRQHAVVATPAKLREASTKRSKLRRASR